MKKILVLLLVLAMSMSLVFTGCSKDEEPAPEPTAEATSTPEPTAEPTAVPTEAPTSTPTPVVTEEPTEEPTAEPTAVPTEEPSLIEYESPDHPIGGDVEPTDEPTGEPGVDIQDPNNPVTPDVTEEPTPTEPKIEPFTEITADGRQLLKEEAYQIFNAIGNPSQAITGTGDIKMTMQYGNSTVELSMGMTILQKDGTQCLAVDVNLFGSGYSIVTYTVDNGDGTSTVYTNSLGSWLKYDATTDEAGNNVNSITNVDSFQNGVIRKNPEGGYIITGNLMIQGAQLDCMINLDNNFDFMQFTVTLPEEATITDDDGNPQTLAAFSMDVKAGCDDIELPEEALNAETYEGISPSGTGIGGIF